MLFQQRIKRMQLPRNRLTNNLLEIFLFYLGNLVATTELWIKASLLLWHRQQKLARFRIMLEPFFNNQFLLLPKGIMGCSQQNVDKPFIFIIGGLYKFTKIAKSWFLLFANHTAQGFIEILLNHTFLVRVQDIVIAYTRPKLALNSVCALAYSLRKK